MKVRHIVPFRGKKFLNKSRRKFYFFISYICCNVFVDIKKEMWYYINMPATNYFDGFEVTTQTEDKKVSKDKLELKDELNMMFEDCEDEKEEVLLKVAFANLKRENACEVRVNKNYIHKLKAKLNKIGFEAKITGRFCNKLYISWSSENVDIKKLIKSYEYKLGLGRDSLEELYQDLKEILKERASEHKRRNVIRMRFRYHYWDSDKVKFIKRQLINRFYEDGFKVEISISRNDRWAYNKFVIKW